MLKPDLNSKQQKRNHLHHDTFEGAEVATSIERTLRDLDGIRNR